MKWLSKVIPVVTLAALVVACAEAPEGVGADIVDGGTGTDESSTTSNTTEATSEPGGDESGGESAPGTRDNPLPPGTTVRVGDWEIQVGQVTQDATDVVLAENQFNEIPEGRQAVMWSVTATYGGEGSGTPFVDVSWAFVSSDGNTYGTSMDDYCGVVPQPLDDQGETFSGGMVSGNVCVAVPSEDVAGGLIEVESAFSFEEDRVFFSMG